MSSDIAKCPVVETAVLDNAHGYTFGMSIVIQMFPMSSASLQEVK